MKILTVVGARPQFIKAAPISRELRVAGHREFLVHTGQHYDQAMSSVFFDELNIPQPDINLAVGSGSHGKQTGQMLMRLEQVIQEQKPDWTLVYGDTNSTLAGALAAVKLRVPLAHVEAGLRSFNREMPEEHNRVLTDHCSDLLFCPTQTAVDNLVRESINKDVHLVGDTMYDAVLHFAEIARQRSTILQKLDLEPQKYLLTTVHRAYNTDYSENLRSIIEALREMDETVVFPVHPRTRQKMVEFGFIESLLKTEKRMQPDGKYKDLGSGCPSVRIIDPVGYLDMLMLEQHARMVLTDSGGIQKEAYFFGVPCVTLRPETEWVETVEAGWNVVVGAEKERILEAISTHKWPVGKPDPVFGEGAASSLIVNLLASKTRR